MTISKPNSVFRIELLRLMFKPTERRLETKIVIGGGFKEVYEFARKGMNLIGGGEEQWQESNKPMVRAKATKAKL